MRYISFFVPHTISGGMAVGIVANHLSAAAFCTATMDWQAVIWAVGRVTFQTPSCRIEM